MEYGSAIKGKEPIHAVTWTSLTDIMVGRKAGMGEEDSTTG